MAGEQVIRKYRQADKPALLQLIKLNTPEYFAEIEHADFARYLETEIEHYFVARVDMMIVGCGGINFADEGKTGVISWDIVHPQHQGKGLGSMLLRHRLELLQAEDQVDRIIVRTSQLTHRFYAKHGFVLKATKENYWGEGLDLYAMEFESG